MPPEEFEVPIGGNLPWRTGPSLGGPRREFFQKVLIEMKEELFYTTPNSEIRLVENIWVPGDQNVILFRIANR